MNFGSHAPSRPSPTRLVFATTEAEQTVLETRSLALEKRLRTAPLDILHQSLRDISRIHALLYQSLCSEMPEAIGQYRGTKQTALETARREVRVAGASGAIRAIDPCMEPEEVGGAMTQLHRDIAAYFDNHRGTADISLLAEFTHRFLWVHPFLDGNGHTWRAALIALGRWGGFQISPDWRIHQRPFGVSFSGAVQSYLYEPDMLEDELAQFFQLI